MEGIVEKVLSKDGAAIAYDRSGQGPALILVGGALSTRGAAIAISARLAPHFTVFAFDRRGRGDSGDHAPYAVRREVEDIAALVQAAGGTAFLFGHSSGAVLALEAAEQLSSIKKLAVYEPPFILENSRPPVPTDYVDHLKQLHKTGKPGEAVEYFMTAALRLPPEQIAHMKSSPMWPGLVAVERTLVYDGMIMDGAMDGKPLAADRWAHLAIPVLVMDGGSSPTFMHVGADSLAKLLPHAQRRTLAGQDHGPADDVLSPVLIEFFKG